MAWTTTFLIAWLSGQALAATGPSDTDDTDPPADTDDTDPPADTDDTDVPDPALDLDDDGDGFTPNQGDCDDADAEASPGKAELCFDSFDNDCDGLYDEECDGTARLASLRGGGGCTGGAGVGGTTSAIVLLPLLFVFFKRQAR